MSLSDSAYIVVRFTEGQRVASASNERCTNTTESTSTAVSRKPMADVLGQVYEQFLGKVILLTAGHQAKVEEKPEVRKPREPGGSGS
jgi:hypothetical protein